MAGYATAPWGRIWPIWRDASRRALMPSRRSNSREFQSNRTSAKKLKSCRLWLIGPAPNTKPHSPTSESLSYGEKRTLRRMTNLRNPEMIIPFERRKPLNWQEQFDAQTARYIEACRRNPEFNRLQFEFCGAGLVEREQMLDEIDIPRRPVGREESRV